MKLIIFIIFSLIFSNDIINDANNSFNSILSSYVDSSGKVNYKGIIDNPYSLNDYFEFIENISPNNFPDYFKTSNDPYKNATKLEINPTKKSRVKPNQNLNNAS